MSQTIFKKNIRWLFLLIRFFQEENKKNRILKLILFNCLKNLIITMAQKRFVVR